MPDYSYTNGDGVSQLDASVPNGAIELVKVWATAIKQIKAYLKDPIEGPFAVGKRALPLGSIVMWTLASATLPAEYLLCDGQEITTDYPDLRTLIIDAGNPYSSDASVRTPNFTRRSPYGAGGTAEQVGFPVHLGAVAGTETHQLVTAEMASHLHKYMWNDAAIFATSSTGTGDRAAFSPSTSFSAQPPVVGSMQEPVGSDQVHNNTHRVLSMYFAIKAL